MSTSFIKGNRTRFRNLLAKELAKGNTLLEEDGEREINVYIKDINTCINRLNEFVEKLEETNERLSKAMEGQDGAQEIEALIREDWDYISTVVDCRDELVELQKSLQDQRSPTDNWSSVTVTEERFNQMIQVTAQMQQVIIGQQQLQQQQQISIGQLNNSKTCSVRLPKIEIPSFNGDKLKWSEFWDAFEATIDKNTNISDIEKLNYLLSKITGEAKQSVSGIPLSNENYNVVVDLLKERYGDSQTVINTHYVELINLKSAQNTSRGLRNLYDQIENHLRSLEALKQDINQDVFISMITSKIPKEVLIQLEIQKGARNKWTVKELRELFNNYIAARERAEQQSGSGKIESTGQSYTPMVMVNSAEALVAGAQGFGNRKERKTFSTKCRFCDGYHWSDECPKYTTMESRKQRIKGSCYICLRDGHNANDCLKRGTKCYYCRQPDHHHRSLCPQKFGTPHRESTNLADEMSLQNETINTENSLISSGEMVLMQTARADIKNSDNGYRQNVRMLLDSGSQRTYITESLARKLNLKLGNRDEIMLVTFGSEKPKRIRPPTTKLDIILKDGSTLQISANVVPQIAGEIQRRPVNLKSLKNWEYLWGEFPLADDLPSETETSSVELLIGNDYYLDLILPQKIEVQSGLYMLGSKLGWILSGRTSETVANITESSMLILTYGTEIPKETSLLTCADKSLPVKPNVEDFWNLESIGIRDCPVESDNKVALSKFNETLRYENGRYTVTWPWKDENPDLPENRTLALGRLKSLVRRMKDNPDLIQKYDEIIEDQLRQGVIERVRSESKDTIKHYIPHHAVINPTKVTTKVRIVYDASAKTKSENKSLNECLYRGPILLQNLTGILFRFRLNKIALVADIEKAFLQIGLQEDAKDVTRFFWLKDKNIVKVENNIQTYRFCRVPFGIISSPFLLAATIDHHLKKTDTYIAQNIRDNIYVDNLITGTQSVNQAKELYTVSKQLFKDASMNLRDWMSNSQEVLDEIPVCDGAKGERMKILGLNWTVKEDYLTLTGQIAGTSMLSKRTVLQQVASIYDPLGLYSPVILRGKLFLQALWNQKISWDRLLSNQDKAKWYILSEDLKEITSCNFPRCIGLVQEGHIKYQLLVFCDASKYAYAAAVYLLQQTTKSRRIDLIFAKTRLAPNKQITIPRLELLAALIGTRCLKFVHKELKVTISEKHIWVDSQCVLNWLYSKKTLNTFVANRIKEMKEDKDINFHYISTAENPADIASRGASARELQSNKLWWHGPDWLMKTGEAWPVWKSEDIDKQSEEIRTETKSEFRGTKVLFEAKLVAGEGLSENRNGKLQEDPFNLNIVNFSSVTRLWRVTALVVRFIDKLRKKTSHFGPLHPNEITKAEELWTIYVQRQEYYEVVDSIYKSKSNNLKGQLGIYIDSHGLLRCRGRLENAGLCENTRHPILLPKNHRYTDLIIERYHKTALHTGVSQTLSLIRQNYWIPQGRSAVRKVLRSCTVCRRHEGGSYKMPLMPPLPAERVSESPPFTHTGVDYFGPLFVKSNKCRQKVWVCLYTCLVTRAVHLEMMHDMSTQEFLLGFRRFIARHGKPKKMISDNAAQFKLAAETINKLWGQILMENDVVSYSANQNIHWEFIVELAPWMGGFYERLVALVKRSLRKAIGKVCLTNEQLLTLLKEAEAVINSRPLTYVGDDINSYVTLTPAHFLSLNPKVGVPAYIQDDANDTDYSPTTTSAERMVNMWKKGLKHLNSFWKIWTDDYLLSLRERPQRKLKEPRTKSPFSANVGDVILIKDDLPRGMWRIGRIHELMKSRDGQTRSAKVLLPTNKIIGRPLSLLYPVECPRETDSDPNNGQTNEQSIQSTPVDKQTRRQQPERESARKAMKNIKEQLRQ